MPVREAVEVPPGRAEVVVHRDRYLSGPLAAVSNYLLKISDLTTLLGALASSSLLGYQVSLRAESLKEVTEQPLLNFRTAYTPAAAYELFEALGPQGRAEYQYVNVLSTGLFPLLIAVFLSICVGQVYHRADFGHEWNLFPFIFVLASTMENFGISYMLFDYPNVHIHVAAVCGMVASLKVRFFWYTVVMLAVGASVLAGKLVRKSFTKKQR